MRLAARDRHATAPRRRAHGHRARQVDQPQRAMGRLSRAASPGRGRRPSPPCSSRRTRSFRSGMRFRLMTKPGASGHATGRLRRRGHAPALATEANVRSPTITDQRHRRAVENHADHPLGRRRRGGGLGDRDRRRIRRKGSSRRTADALRARRTASPLLFEHARRSPPRQGRRLRRRRGCRSSQPHAHGQGGLALPPHSHPAPLDIADQDPEPIRARPTSTRSADTSHATAS